MIHDEMELMRYGGWKAEADYIKFKRIVCCAFCSGGGFRPVLSPLVRLQRWTPRSLLQAAVLHGLNLQHLCLHTLAASSRSGIVYVVVCRKDQKLTDACVFVCVCMW